MELPLEIYKTTTMDIIEKQFGFHEYSMVVEAGSAIGDNYLGIVYRIVVTDSVSKQCKNIILKVPPQSEIRRGEFNSHVFFEREITIYNEVLKEFLQFQQSKGIVVAKEGFYEYANYLRSIIEEPFEAVYFEDLKESGFEMFSRFEEPTLNHASLLMETLGKFHAISYAIKDQSKEGLSKYREWKDVMITKEPEKLNNMWGLQFKKAIESLDPVNNAEVIKKCESIFDPDTMPATFERCINGKIMEQYAVICHGDCWNNNMLFKNNKQGKPIQIRLLDFQISRYASPALDLLYYMCCSTHTTLRANHYEELLQIYHKSLTTFMARLGSDAKKIFPFSALQGELKRVGKFGLLMAAFIVPMVVQKAEHAMDMDAMLENMKNGQDVDLMKMEDSTLCSYNVRMRGIIMDLDRYGYLD